MIPCVLMFLLETALMEKIEVQNHLTRYFSTTEMAALFALVALLLGVARVSSAAVDSLTFEPPWILDDETGFEYGIFPFEQDFDESLYSCSTYTTSMLASLPAIHTKREHNFITKVVLPTQGNVARSYWIGSRHRTNFLKYRKEVEKQWINVDGSPFDIMSKYYRPSYKACQEDPTRDTCCTQGVDCLFAPNQPNRRGQGIYKTCMSLSYSGNVNKMSLWNDMRCTNKMHFICKRKNEDWYPNATTTQPATTTPAPTTDSAVDEDGFVVDGNLGPNDFIYPSITLQDRFPFGVVGFGSVMFFTIENDHKVYKYNIRTSGTLKFGGKFGTKGAGNGQFDTPLGLALSPNNNRLYVVDSANCRVQALNPNTGAFIFAFGSCGSGNGQFIVAKGIAVHSSGDIFVTDTALHRITRFTSAGVFVATWGSQGSGIGQFDSPTGVSFLNDGTLIVCDSRNNRLVFYHKLNHKAVLRTVGEIGNMQGQLRYPSGLFQHPTNGNIYVSENGNNRISVFTANGAFIKIIGSTGQLLKPTSVFVRNNVLTVTNTASNQIVFYAA
eukprot:m.221525 g.221525  ORF g.221525 m.221525 type:complete len:554 (-) comp15827_c0_seq1:265-1926(-)